MFVDFTFNESSPVGCPHNKYSPYPPYPFPTAKSVSVSWTVNKIISILTYFIPSSHIFYTGPCKLTDGPKGSLLHQHHGSIHGYKSLSYSHHYVPAALEWYEYRNRFPINVWQRNDERYGSWHFC